MLTSIARAGDSGWRTRATVTIVVVVIVALLPAECVVLARWVSQLVVDVVQGPSVYIQFVGHFQESPVYVAPEFLRCADVHFVKFCKPTFKLFDLLDQFLSRHDGHDSACGAGTGVRWHISGGAVAVCGSRRSY